jgi:hypothetical protein
MTLHEVGEHQGTDQATVHDYLRRLEPFFEPFREEWINILEIGVAQGASIRTWHNYFFNATIVGVDKDPACWMPNLNFPKLRIVNGDAGSVEFWQRLELTSKRWSIVIDDGSHRAPDVVTAFEMLWPLVSNGGLYVIEDVHVNWMPEYGTNWLSYFTNRIGSMTRDGERNGKQDIFVNDYAFMHFTRGLIIIGKL